MTDHTHLYVHTLVRIYVCSNVCKLISIYLRMQYLMFIYQCISEERRQIILGMGILLQFNRFFTLRGYYAWASCNSSKENGLYYRTCHRKTVYSFFFFHFMFESFYNLSVFKFICENKCKCSVPEFVV